MSIIFFSYYNVIRQSLNKGESMEKHRQINVLSFLDENTNEYAEKTALGIKNQMGWYEYTYRGVGLMSRRLASFLLNNLQVKKGDRLAILSESKPEYL